MATRTRRFGLLVWVVLVWVVISSHAHAQPTDSKRDEARTHFELGLSHFDREEWPAALVEFLKSHEILPTRSNTKDSAICLRKVGRFDEALDMYEALVRDFPDLTPIDRASAQREISDLQASVGTIALVGAPDAASVTVDGVDRGRTPLKPIRLSAGTHSVRVTKENSLPFDARVDLAGRQAATVRVTLAALTQAGRLHVSEHEGRSLDVLVDGAVVGQTPWEGALAPGPHTVALRGVGNEGTPPALTTVNLNDVTTLDLQTEQLASSLRVDLKPLAATLTLDGVPIGKGVWQGRLRSGHHKLTATLEGYATLVRDITIAGGESGAVAASLQPILAEGRRGIALEIVLGVSIGLVNASEIARSCTGGCVAPLMLGFDGALHASYQLKSGLGVGLHAGYLVFASSLDNRATFLAAPGKPNNVGTVNDNLLTGGLVAGIDGHYRTSGSWPLTLRVGIGAFIGTVRDHRTGKLTDSKGLTYALDTTQSPTAAYFDIAPEIALGRKFGNHFEVNVGLEGHVLAALSIPRWDKAQAVPAGGDGIGTFTADSLAGSVIFALVPRIGVKYEF